MATFIAWLGWLLLLAGIGLMLLTWRQPKPVRPVAILVAQGFGIGALALFSALSNSPLSPAIWLLLLAAGALAGMVVGKTIKVEGSPQGIMMRYTAPYLALWGGLLALSQLSAIVLKSVPAILLGLTVISQGINTGIQGRILWHYRGQQDGPNRLVSVLLLALLLVPVAAGPAIAAAPANPAIPNAVVNSGYPLTDAEVAKLWYRPFRRIADNQQDVRKTDGCITMSVHVKVEYNETYTVSARNSNNNRDNVRPYLGIINVLATDSALKNHPNTKYPPTEAGFLTAFVNYEFYQHGNFAQQGYPQLFYGQSKNKELGSLVVWGLYKGYFIQVDLMDRNEWLPAPSVVLSMVLAYGNKLPPAKGSGGGGSSGSDLTDDEAAAAVLWSSLLLALGQGLIYLLQGGGIPWRRPGVTVTMPPGQDSGVMPPQQPQAPPKPPQADVPPGIPGQQQGGKVFTAGYGWVDPDKTSQELVRLEKARLQALDAGRKGDVDLIDAKLALQQGRLNAATRTLVDASEQKALIRESIAHQQKTYETFMKHDRFFGGLANTATVSGYAADFGIDVLAGITGPAGKTVKMWYTVGKGLGKGLGMAIRDGGQLAANLSSGAAEGLFDIGVGTVTDKATGFIGKTFHNKIPLLKDYDAGIEISRHESADYVKDAFLGQTIVKSAYTHGIQQGVSTSIKGAGQGMAQGFGLSYGTDWVKKLIGFRE